MPDVLLVFVKEPRPGHAKTRLVPALGAEGAAQLYRVLADEEIRATRPRGDEYRRLFFFTPPAAQAAIASWLGGEDLRHQHGPDLGERMAHAFATAFEEGASRVAIVGTDAPWVSRAIVVEALDALHDHDVAIGPARDGGYYLLALGRPHPELFRGIAWSTPSVFHSTVERAGTLGLTVRVLPPLTDIDTLEDVRTEWPKIRPLLTGRPLLAEVEKALGLRPA
jgi:rSAM/selenodomain-associated transferase 1